MASLTEPLSQDVIVASSAVKAAAENARRIPLRNSTTGKDGEYSSSPATSAVLSPDGIRRVAMLTARATPRLMPRVLIKAKNAEATPSLGLGAEAITSLVFGAEKRPIPNPISTNIKAISKMVESRPSVDRK